MIFVETDGIGSPEIPADINNHISFKKSINYLDGFSFATNLEYSQTFKTVRDF